MSAAALGATLLAAGLRRRSFVGSAMALAGGWLLYRAVGRRFRRTSSDDTTGGLGDRAPDAEAPTGATTVERTITVDGSADELHRFWRDPDLLTQVVGDFATVTSAGEDRHRWTVSAPLGLTVEWETEILEDRPGEVLRWRTDGSAPLPNEGTVRFRPAPADRGTEVTLALRFDPPGGRYGRVAMERFGVVPDALADGALYRFKSLAETGEIPTLERNPSARGAGDLV